MTRRNITREKFETTSWGADYLRELDLVIAVNELASMRDSATLYNDWFDRFAAERCAPLDKELEFKKLDTIVVPAGEGSDHTRLELALTALQGLPRGHWAVVRSGDTYDAYMSDGYGGLGTRSGNKFTHNSAMAPDFNATVLYGHVLSMITYLQRNQVSNRIMRYSLELADIKKGQVFENIWIDGKYGKMAFAGVKPAYYVGGTDAMEVIRIRRGTKAKNFIWEQSHFARAIGVPPAMPPEFDHADNEARLIPQYRKAPTAETALPSEDGFAIKLG